MSLTALVTPKRPRNLRLTLALVALLLLIYFAACQIAPWNPKRGAGLVFGMVAALLFVFEMCYPARRPRARPLFTAMNWAQAHIYLGVLALACVFIHAGFAAPRGWMGWALLLLSVWTSLSGLLGVFLQKWLPVQLSEGLRVEAIFERIPSLVTGLRHEADALMEGASDTLDNFYRTQVQKKLARLDPRWSYVSDVRSGRERALEPFWRMTQYVEPQEKERVADLMNIFTEKLELDAQYSVQRVLRNWVRWTLHVPCAGLLMGLLLVHILAWAFY